MRQPVPTASFADALPHDEPLAIVRDDDRMVVASEPQEVVTANGRAALDALDALRPGWWAGFVSYGLGHSLERVLPGRPHAPQPPDVCLVRFGARIEIGASGQRRTFGRGPDTRRLERALANAPHTVEHPTASEWDSSMTESEYEARVETIVELIRAGECYQVNLARHIRSTGPIAAGPLWAAIEEGNPAPRACFLRLPPRHVVSASPELFLAVDRRRVVTRPIKGTAEHVHELASSEKDRAENVMIVDMARNDLGRVCRVGEVAVPELCALEQHPGLHHLVSTVEGTLREDVGVGGLLEATFPPASITGAPKPRVLQTIEDLETAPRGIYCGAIGFVDTIEDRARLAVAIRTFVLDGERATLGVGAGITSDSDPAREWAETRLKAARLLAVAGARVPVMR